MHLNVLYAIIRNYSKKKEVLLVSGLGLLVAMLINVLIDSSLARNTTNYLSVYYFKLLILTGLHNAIILFNVFLFQQIENKNDGLKRFNWLPVSFFNLFLYRLVCILLISILYWLLLYISDILLLQKHTDFIYIINTYFFQIISALSSYIIIVVIASLFTNNLVFGITLLTFFTILSFVNITDFLPFAYSSRSLIMLHTNNTFSDSIFKNGDISLYGRLNLIYSVVLITTVLLTDKKVNLITYYTAHGK